MHYVVTMTQQNPTNLTPQQWQLVKFVASGKVDTNGNKWTIEDFCDKVLKINRSTYYDWVAKQEVRMAILEETMGRVSQFVPAMVQAQVAKAVKKQDTQAFMAVMRQSGVLKSDKQELKAEVDGNMTFNLVNYADDNHTV